MAPVSADRTPQVRFRLLYLAAATTFTFTPILTGAQLRPLGPAQVVLFRDSVSVRLEAGAGRLSGQRASLAGEKGNLWEIGNFSVSWRTGRVILEAAGTVQRRFRETGRFDAPYPGVEPSDRGRRHDSGDYRISTTVRVTPQSSPIDGIVRFGTRLPTTDNTRGLDRDATDFFATIGGSGAAHRVFLSGEAGVGIHSTREERFEQDDLFLYAIGAELRSFPVRPSVTILGQVHGATHSAIRGVENLGELRAGLRAGTRRWVRAELVKGYERFSPPSGLIVSAGMMM